MTHINPVEPRPYAPYVSYDSRTEVDDIPTALAALARGEMIIVADNENRENEGDLLMAADFATPQAINFMITHGRGLVCVTVTPERAAQLELRPMVERNEEFLSTAFTVSVDGAREHGVTTGISAFERSRTIELLISGSRRDLVAPGHIFPLVARPGGVLERDGHTEASVDLARLAGRTPMGVIVEIVGDDGHMARFDDLVKFARKHHLVFTTIEKLRAYRIEHGV